MPSPTLSGGQRVSASNGGGGGGRVSFGGGGQIGEASSQKSKRSSCESTPGASRAGSERQSCNFDPYSVSAPSREPDSDTEVPSPISSSMAALLDRPQPLPKFSGEPGQAESRKHQDRKRVDRRPHRLSSIPVSLSVDAGEEEQAAAKIQALRRGNIERNAGMPRLLRALQQGDEELACKLLRGETGNGAHDLHARDDVGCTPLFLAAQSNFHRAVAELLERGADVDAGKMLVHEEKLNDIVGAFTRRARNTSMAVRRLQRKSFGDADMPELSSPAWVAAKHGHAQVMELLINARADVNARAKDGRSPVFIATKGGHAGILQMLVAAGADVNVGSQKGKTPLLIAVTNDHVAALDVLIAAGARLDTVVDGMTALATARQRSLHYHSARLAIAGLEPLASKEELLATGEPAVLHTSLPAAFASDPLDCMRLVADLVRGYRQEAITVMAVDTQQGEQLLVQLRTTQQVLVAMLRTVDPSELERILLSERGVAALLEAVRSECKGVLSYAGVQRALVAQWHCVPPKSVGEGLQIAVHALGHLVLAACYPPFQKTRITERQAIVDAAVAAVLARNPEPVRPAEDLFVRFKVDAVKVGSSYSGPAHDRTWEHAMHSWRVRAAG